MKIISWNVNGIRAAWGHGLSQFIDNFGADIYAFQETKTSERLPMLEVPGYYPYWSFCDGKNGYSGTLVLSREKPLCVDYGIGDDEFDVEGRIITLEYAQFYLVNCYVPNSQHAPGRHDYRLKWDVLLRAHIISLSSRKPVILCGDFNCPISDDDIYEASKWV
ncbi:MAG: endonuclease/exonuclease/phosphatase family protein, partial [Clostridiales bacterium]|nr:endonuclease/exonuclease/phosphatase family protein [Clostridiales bacterium]